MRRVWLVALIAVVAVAACSSDDASDTIPVPTVPASEVGEEALMTAVLKWDPGGECIYGVSNALPEGMPLVFPHGYAALADRHAIVDAAGAVVAAEGDRVDLGGGRSDIVDGSIEAFGVSNVPCPDGPVWVVQHPIEPATRAQ